MLVFSSFLLRVVMTWSVVACVGADGVQERGGEGTYEEEPFWEEAFGLGEVGLDCFHFGGGGGVAIERVPGVRGRGFLGRRRVGGGLAG